MKKYAGRKKKKKSIASDREAAIYSCCKFK
jgi:hypothetical protein